MLCQNNIKTAKNYCTEKCNTRAALMLKHFFKIIIVEDMKTYSKQPVNFAAPVETSIDRKTELTVFGQLDLARIH